MEIRRKKKTEKELSDRTFNRTIRRKFQRRSISLFFRKIFRKFLAYRIISICFAILALLFAVSVFFSKAGEFVVSLDKDMSDYGFVLSETPDFKDARVKLFSEALDGVNNININDLPTDIDKIDGKHNGENYIAYSYYIQNAGKKEAAYTYELNIVSSSLGVDKAAWIMVFQNGKEVVYAKESADGEPECQYSYEDFSIAQFSKVKNQVVKLSDTNKGYLTDKDIENYGFLRIEGLKEFRTTPFINKGVVCSEKREDMKPGDIVKYTVVVWLEGEDPECIDDILGGHLSMNMQFRLVEEID